MTTNTAQLFADAYTDRDKVLLAIASTRQNWTKELLHATGKMAEACMTLNEPLIIGGTILTIEQKPLAQAIRAYPNHGQYPVEASARLAQLCQMRRDTSPEAVGLAVEAFRGVTAGSAGHPDSGMVWTFADSDLPYGLTMSTLRRVFRTCRSLVAVAMLLWESERFRTGDRREELLALTNPAILDEQPAVLPGDVAGDTDEPLTIDDLAGRPWGGAFGNTLKAHRALVGLLGHAEASGTDVNDEAATAIRDLLGDLFHLTRAMGVDMDPLIIQAYASYLKELGGN